MGGIRGPRARFQTGRLRFKVPGYFHQSPEIPVRCAPLIGPSDVALQSRTQGCCYRQHAVYFLRHHRHPPLRRHHGPIYTGTMEYHNYAASRLTDRRIHTQNPYSQRDIPD